MISTPTDTAAAKRALVRTYNTPAYVDPWDAVEDFESVQEVAAKHPNKGSSALSSIVELPRNRIRPWLDDSMPDCYRALQIALSNGWIIESWDDETAAGLNALAAWLCSSGSVNDNWVPMFVADAPGEIGLLKAAARTANVRLTRTRSDPDRPTEWRPVESASILGRVLYTWTGVRGDKSPDVAQFPRYVQFAPEWVAADFAKVYVHQRATVRDDRDGALQIQEIRTDRYRRKLVELLERVVSTPDEIRGESWPVFIRGDAIDELLQPLSFVDQRTTV